MAAGCRLCPVSSPATQEVQFREPDHFTSSYLPFFTSRGYRQILHPLTPSFTSSFTLSTLYIVLQPLLTSSPTLLPPPLTLGTLLHPSSTPPPHPLPSLLHLLFHPSSTSSSIPPPLPPPPLLHPSSRYVSKQRTGDKKDGCVIFFRSGSTRSLPLPPPVSALVN